ncbi:MXAN_6577-like cysteine-rich protein [Polyangium mundeleinium]|uniref:MXAN_6577-like cysteine-rich protein n=1 Tax=Polyangium mundeleinium TaxID=2995306 RepID=A0ABT5EES8_9BACT|nr:MXAN_6577-like cysteine-rich protein [Polyangium mundeleinium]MDC0739897.1 MXAN_6577-like cysteine-rich protein [Polyangium mundeleinium]
MLSVDTRRRPGFPALLFSLLLVLWTAACGDDPAPPPACAGGTTSCNGTCVNVAADAQNCGACGTTCSADETCSDGACVLDCVSGQTTCGSTCVDTSKDLANCGACGNPCAAGEVCSNGTCALSCQASLSDCSGTCVDTSKDLANCGACGNPCAAGEVCSNGACALSCQASLSDCGGTCVNQQTDVENCGGCGLACAPGEVCSNGMCALSCQVDLTDCGGVCANLQTDLGNCGACGQACAPGEVCSNGMCALSCQAELVACDGLCVDTATNPAHCGACGTTCKFDEVCSNGTCESTTPVDLQFLSVSDWHGQLDPLVVNNVEIGGASVLSAYFQKERTTNPNTLVFTAGDGIGASPPLASYFNEEPAIKAMSLMGIDAYTFGNHDFDRGVGHLQSMIDLSTFEWVTSNLANIDGNLTGVATPYHMVEVGGLKVAIIGITSPDAPASTAPGSFGTITIKNPITSAMEARNAAEAAGAKVFVAIVHLGASLCDQATGTCQGPLLDFAKGVNGFDVILGDHTDIQVNTVINGARVVENRSKGLTYARVELTVVPWNGFVAKSSATILSPVKSQVTPDPAVEAMLQPYRAQLAAELDAVIGVATDVFPRGNNVERLVEVAIGNLAADAMRVKYGTQLAFCNGGGLRTSIPSSYTPANTMLRRLTPGYAAGPPYDIVRGDALAVLPFGNVIMTRTVTGAQLWQAMENGISGLPTAAGRFPQISGFGFTYSASAPAGSRIQEIHLANGTPIAANGTTYTLAVPDFLNAGGDGYTMLLDGQGTSREIHAEVLIEHIQALGTITPTVEGRIVAVP